MKEMNNTGQIVRSSKTGASRYTPISNEILQSETLTPEEKSILCHLLSLPADWVVYKTLIWEKMNMGKKRFNSHWKGLVEKGYIQSTRTLDPNSNLVRGWKHIVYEEPTIPFTDNPNLGLSQKGSVNKVISTQSNNLQKKEKEITNKELIEKKSPVDKLRIK